MGNALQKCPSLVSPKLQQLANNLATHGSSCTQHQHGGLLHGCGVLKGARQECNVQLRPWKWWLASVSLHASSSIAGSVSMLAVMVALLAVRPAGAMLVLAVRSMQIH